MGGNVLFSDYQSKGGWLLIDVGWMPTLKSPTKEEKKKWNDKEGDGGKGISIVKNSYA